MNQKKLKFLVICVMFSMILIGFIVLGVCTYVKDMYFNELALKYERLAVILVGLNGVPSLWALYEVVQFALHGIVDNQFTIVKTSKSLERIFYLQSAYTFLSILIISVLENVNPIFALVAKYFIVFISLTLALFFGALHDGLTKSENEKNNVE